MVNIFLSQILLFCFFHLLNTQTQSNPAQPDVSGNKTKVLDCSNPTHLVPPILRCSSQDAKPLLSNKSTLIVPKNYSGNGNIIRMTCIAPYPIEIVNEYEKMKQNDIADHLGELIQTYYKEFKNVSTYTYYIHVDFQIVRHHDKIEELVFRCHSIMNPCLQQTVVYKAKARTHLEKNLDNQLEFSISSNIGPVKTLDELSEPPVETEDCEANFYFLEVEHEVKDIKGVGIEGGTVPSYSLACEFKDGVIGKIQHDWCFTDVSLCSSILRHKRQPKKCVKRLEQQIDCVGCEMTNEDYFLPSVVTCNIGSVGSAGNLVIFGIPQQSQRPAIYFAEEDVEPSSMIYMNEFNGIQQLWTNLSVICSSSYFYNVASFQFALDAGSDQLKFISPKTREADTSWEFKINVKSQVMRIYLNDTRITRIFCFGGNQRSFFWNNASRPVKIIDPHAPQDNLTSNQKTDRTLEPSGQAPVTSMGNSNEILTVVIPIIVILTIIFSTIVGILWRQNKRQEKFIQNLTKEEVRDFREGNPELDPSDVHATIKAIPFNSDLEIPRDLLSFDEKERLGSGEYGVVLKGILRNPLSKNDELATIPVAVKTVKPKVEVSYFKALLSEIKILAYIGRYQHIACLIGACTTEIERLQVLAAIEFCEKGDLRSYLLKRQHFFRCLFTKNNTIVGNNYVNKLAIEETDIDKFEDEKSLSSLDLLHWAMEISKGMMFLSQKKVIHGDLALRNVLLTADKVAKISDFGLSRQLLLYSNYVKTEQVPLPWKWLSIEALKNMEFSVQSDCWSYGVTLWELFSLGAHPYPGYVWNHDFFQQLVDGYRMGQPQYANHQIYDLMLECWNHHPRDRPSFANVFEQLERVQEILQGTSTGQNSTTN